MHYHYFTLEQRDALSRQILDMTAQDGKRKASAIDYLHSSEYGICEVCGRDIAYAQLMSDPLRKTCRYCEP
jgi:RNA polymerase-binding transcription factor DksA